MITSSQKLKNLQKLKQLSKNNKKLSSIRADCFLLTLVNLKENYSKLLILANLCYYGKDEIFQRNQN